MDAGSHPGCYTSNAATWEKQQRIAQGLGPCSQVGDPDEAPAFLLALVWSSSGFRDHLESNQQMEALSLYLVYFLSL